MHSPQLATIFLLALSLVTAASIDPKKESPQTCSCPVVTCGPPGNNGLPGRDGRDGKEGAKGEKGDTGLQGVRGLQGPPGKAGPAGATGAAGHKGSPGASGPAATKGEPGTAGPIGPKGSLGPAGPIGVTGAAGAKGAVGDPGPAGAAGQKGSVGSPGPAGAAGLKGAVGATGAVGPKGSAGPPGTTGSTGPKGGPGAPGAAGAKGANGSPGLKGDRGLLGPKGEKGDSRSSEMDALKRQVSALEIQMKTLLDATTKQRKAFQLQNARNVGEKLFVTNYVEVNYEAAAVACKKAGGILATPKNAAENAAINEIVVLTGKSAHIGINDIKTEGTFQYLSGEKIGYTNWRPNEPNNYKGIEDCVHMVADGKWNDMPCGEKRLTVCEF